jgi:hypothetical protein
VTVTFCTTADALAAFGMATDETVPSPRRVNPVGTRVSTTRTESIEE